MDTIPIPTDARNRDKRKKWLEEGYPEDYQPPRADLPADALAVPETVDISDSPISNEELMDIGQHELEAPEQDGYGGEDAMDLGLVINSLQPGTTRPEPTFLLNGSLICDRISDMTPGERLDQTYCNTYFMGPMLRDGFTFETQSREGVRIKEPSRKKETSHQYVDQDILGGFGPSRIPPRVAFKLSPARMAIEREITDLLQSKNHEPPAMIEVASDDSRYRSAPRVHSALVVKRKGIDSYKGRLCVRGDTVPLQTTAFVSSPTVHRCAVKLICAIASQLEWAIHAVDISQAFLQSSNLNPKDRVIVIPPNMIHLPWSGRLHPMNHDISRVTHNRGFLLLRPLYGGRDAPMRWFIALPKRLREHGFAQM